MHMSARSSLTELATRPGYRVHVRCSRDTNRTPYATRAEESTHAGLAGDRMSDLGGASRCWIVLMRSWDDRGAMECVSSSGGLLELRSEHPHTTGPRLKGEQIG